MATREPNIQKLDKGRFTQWQGPKQDLPPISQPVPNQNPKPKEPTAVSTPTRFPKTFPEDPVLRSIPGQPQSLREKFQTLFFVCLSFFTSHGKTLGLIILGIGSFFLWVGAQVDTETRKNAIMVSFSLVPETLEPHTVDKLLHALESIYTAIESLKGAAFLGSKAFLILATPVVQITVAMLYYLTYFLQFMWPYLGVCGEYLLQGLILLKPYGLLLLEYLLQGATLLGENLIKGAHILVEKFLEQDKMNIFVELITPAIVFLLWLFKQWILRQQYPKRIKDKYDSYRKWVRSKYRALLDYIRQKSLLLAAFIPHLLLVIPVGLTIYFIPQLLSSISRGYILILVSLLYPEFNSIGAIETKNEAERIRCLTYWIIFSVISFVTSIIEYIPFASKISIPYVSEAFFCFFIWLQLPWTDGCTMTYNFVIPIVSKALELVPLPNWFKPAKENDEKSWAIKIFINVLPDQYRSKASSFIFRSGYLVFATIFFATPPYFTGIGCILVGIGLPYFASINSLFEKDKTNAEKEQVWWLTYWIGFFLFNTFHDCITNTFGLENFPFWYQIKLGIVMWLQLPFTQGAETIYQKFLNVAYNMVMSFFNVASMFRTPATPRVRPDNADATPSSPFVGNSSSESKLKEEKAVSEPTPVKRSFVITTAKKEKPENTPDPKEQPAPRPKFDLGQPGVGI